MLLYEILAARSPFVAPTLDETLRRVITHGPPPVRRLNPRVPRELSELVDRLLEKDPAHRPQTAGAVEAELVHIAAADQRPAPGASRSPGPPERKLATW